MKLTYATLVVLVMAGSMAFALSKQEAAAAQQDTLRIDLLNRIETLKKTHERLQERYRETIENRWKQQQEHLRVKEDYKASIDGLRQRQEILYNELSRAKEEALVRENGAQEQEDALKEKNELLDFLEKQVRDKVDDAKKSVREGFPMNMEARIAELSAGGGRSAAGKSASDELKWLLDRKIAWLNEGAGISIGRETIMQSKGDPVIAEVLTVGNCLTYGVTATGDAYVLSAGAKSRQFRYEWKPVKILSVKTMLVQSFPKWMSLRRIQNTVPVDVLQSSISEQLFEGRRQSIAERFLEYVKAGGPNILVLWLAGLVALCIVVERLIVLLMRGINAEAFTERLLSHAKEGKNDLAEKLLKSSPSTLARCLRLLWQKRGSSRLAAEKTLKEAFLKELPPLESRLSLLAALGAAAPLLGLLGTVGGLITLFHVLNMAGTNDTKVLAGGISEALVNTLTGLAIAIPVLLLHGYLSERAAYIQNSTQAAAAEVLNALWPVANQTLNEKAPNA
jgi:biopolymer transport protein ExbB